MKEEQQEIKKDLDQDSTVKNTTDANTKASDDTATKDTTTDLNTSSESDGTDSVEVETGSDTDTDKNIDTNSSNSEEYEKLNKNLDTIYEKTNEKLVELEKQELSSLKIPKQSLYKKREIFLKDATDKINSAFKYLAYINRRKKTGR